MSNSFPVEGSFKVGNQHYPIGEFSIGSNKPSTHTLSCKVSTAPLSQRPLLTSAMLTKDIVPLPAISPKLLSGELQQFYKSNILPLVQQIIKGKHENFGELVDAISNAKAIDPNAKKDHVELDSLLKALVQQAAPKPVNPQHINGIYGIPNKTGNDCFISSILQLIVNTPHLAEKVMKHCPKIGVFVKNYEKGVDSEKLRNDFNKLFFNEHRGSSQEDMTEYLEKILTAIGFKYEVDKFYPEDQDIGPIIPLRIDFGTPSEQLTKYILNQQMTFQSNPQSLILHLDRTSPVELAPKDVVIYKDDRVANIPTLFGHDGSNYELTYASLHDGSNKSGHYTSLIKKEGQWHLVNDSQVTALDEETAQELVNKKGCLFHYKKISDPEIIKPPVQEKVSAPQVNTQPSLIERAKWGLICALPVIGYLGLSVLGFI